MLISFMGLKKQLDYGEGAEQVGDQRDTNQRDTDHHDQDYISLSKEVRCHHLNIFICGCLFDALEGF